jgi:anthranilate synthase component 1
VEAFFLLSHTLDRPFMSLRPRPSIRELPGDLLTPVGAYLRIRDLGPGFLLESIERGQQVGRYSFLGAGCEVVTLDHGADDPFAPLRAFLARHADPGTAGLPPFAGGVVGHLAYDAVHRFEPTVPLPEPRPDDVPGPSRFLLVPVVAAFDHVRQRVQVVAQPGHEALADEITERLTGPAPVAAFGVPPLAEGGARHAEVTRERYLEMVVRAKEHITAGDAFQVVPSQRHLRQTARTPAAIYRALRAVNPSPYMFFLETDGLAVVGASPETHVSLTADGTAALRPIAGTRPRGDGAAADDALAAELANDEKERAEHMMLVDLARNDLARVCEPGTVRPTRLLEVERYSHVMHLVSDVQGRLRETEDAFSLLRDTFPAGTVSGAPKVRAMQIISELEPHRRGIYAGAVGYIGFGGAMDTCIALRTIVIRDGVVRLQAGSGVVADSVPETEHVECINKMAALQRAVDLAETGAYGR